MSDVQREQPEAKMKVWRPEGFAGVEVERFDNVVGLNLSPFVTAGHEITVAHRSGESLLSYERQPHRLKGENLFANQHAGAPCSVDMLDNVPLSFWTLRLYPNAMQQLKADLGLPEGFSYLPELMAPEGLNEPLANLTTDAVLAFDEPTSTIERESRLLGLLYTVLKYCSDTPPPEKRLGQEHKAVSLVKEVLHTHPEHDHSFKDLSTLTGLSQKYLGDVFKQEVGLPPHQYLTGLRVHLAKNRLAKGEAVAAVAHGLGFYDQAHFTKVFKKYVRVTPGKFRRDTLNAT